MRYSNNMASKKRSFAKTLTWRMLATTDTILISFILTKSIGVAVGIGMFEVITKTILYYLHERWWDKIKWERH